MSIRPASLYAVFGSKEELFKRVMAHYLLYECPFVKDALEEPTAFDVAKRLLRDTAIFLTRPGFPHGCLTIQTSLAASDEARRVHNDLIALRLKAQRALRQRFTRAKKDGDLPQTADPASLARPVTALYQGMTVQGINGATRRDLLDLANAGLQAWPKAS
jgi:AcrR family transcriptional regulator